MVAVRHRLACRHGGGRCRWSVGYVDLPTIWRSSDACPCTLNAYTNATYALGCRRCRQRNTAEVTALLTRDNVVKFLAQSRASGLSPRSVARRMAGLRAFCRYLKQEKVLPVDPLLDLQTPRLPQRLPHFLSLDEVDRCFANPAWRRHGATGTRRCWRRSMPRGCVCRNWCLCR